MQDIPSNEEIDVLVRGYIQFAYDEMQRDGWVLRRKELREEFEIGPFGQDVELPAMVTNQDNLDDMLHWFFCREILSPGWFEAYCVLIHPEWDKRNEDVYCHFKVESLLRNWFYHTAREAQENGTDGLYELKEILGLNLSLK